MQLKRLYNFDAPRETWTPVHDTCPNCRGKGKVVSDDLKKVVDCPDCERGIQTRFIPPVAGIKVLRAKAIQHFSTRIIEGGIQEGWLTLEGDTLTIHDAENPVQYRVVRRPGKYVDGVINYFDCELVGEEV